jgi:hypothetical protein
MAEITPKLIIERHQKYPESTEKLIEAYAFTEYKKAITDLFNFVKLVEVENSDTALLVATKFDLKEWKDLKHSHWYLNKSIDLK